MEDYFSAEGYSMVDNEKFLVSLLHVCNLSFQKFVYIIIIMLLLLTGK